MISELRYAARQLRKSPGFTVVSVAMLALALGATAAVLAAGKALVVDALPYRDPGQLVAIWTNPGQPLSTADFLDIAAENTTLASTGAFNFRRLNLGGARARSIEAVTCTAGVATALGIAPARGRWFDDSDASAGTAVISHALWQRELAGSPAAIGSSIRLDGEAVRVVGILPADFAFRTQRSNRWTIDVFVPLKLERNEDRGSHWLAAVGRLKPGVTVQQADADLKAIGARLTREYPRTNSNKPFLARALATEVAEGPAARLPMLFAAVGLVLLMACANVACMLLARGAHRQSEYGVRLALGATRAATVRLVLAESLLLALAGIALGAVVAFGGVGIVRRMLLDSPAAAAALRPDPALLAAAAGLVLLATALSGLPPALTAARAGIADALREAGCRTQGGSRMRHRFLRSLVVVQIALALVLANAAVMLSQSYLNVWKANGRLNSEHTLVAGVSLAGSRYQAADDRIRFWEGFLPRVRAIPGVASAAVTTKLPLEGGNNGWFLVEGERYDPAARRTLVERSGVSPEYFAAMGIPVLRGGTIEPAGSEARVVSVVVNQAFADHYWPGRNPIGRSVFPNTPDRPWTAVVAGVVENVRQWGAEQPPRAEMYAEYAFWPRPNASLVVRSAIEPERLLGALRAELAAVDSDLAFFRVRRMDQVVGDSTLGRRLLMQLVDGFMAAALLLAALGIFGTLSHMVARRTGEIGLRMVLGAHRGDIAAYVLRLVLPWIGGGLALGALLSLASARVARSSLYGVEGVDPIRISVLTLLVAAALVAACWLPARRAAAVEPMVALRHE